MDLEDRVDALETVIPTLATKDDLKVLQVDMSTLKVDVAGLRADVVGLRADMAGLRAYAEVGFARLGASTDGRFAEAQSRTDLQFAEAHARTDLQFAADRARTDEQFAALRTAMIADKAELVKWVVGTALALGTVSVTLMTFALNQVAARVGTGPSVPLIFNLSGATRDVAPPTVVHP